MRNIKLFSLGIFFLFFLFVSCQKEEPISNDRLIIGISADIKTINPLYAFSVDEGSIDDILFLSLLRINWNEIKGDLDVEPWLADSWEWSDDSLSLKFFLRDDVKWSDGIKVTAEDVAYSFDLYSNPQVQSKFYGTFEKLYLNEDLSVDMSKSIEVIDSFTVKINFIPNKNVKLTNVILPIIPKHIFEKYEYDEIPTADINFNPVTCGPYRLKKWERNEMI
ncbi:MAG: ABC transporter substrate-binding protein, partial [Ignavibacteriaceae bacterium]|nr:ABC transporter substrate-binding protein [Ignavibacteriaceae bacterium]